MLPDDVRITKIAQDAKFSGDGTFTPQIRVEFMVGKNGPFSERFDKDKYSADARDLCLTDFANHVRTP